ncbi:hypothetical protein CR513_36988, partial [Mucuna pruriens]
MDIHKIIFHKFTPSHGPPCVISQIIKQKFDEPWSSWTKVRLDICDLWFREFKGQTIKVIFEQKGSRIYKNAMNKIRNGHNCVTWILPNRLIVKENWVIDKGASTYYVGSISTSAHYEKNGYTATTTANCLGGDRENQKIKV